MEVCPVLAERPRFDVADIVRAHRGALEQQYAISLAQKRVLSAIAACRTPALGGHIDVCCSCGHEHHVYHSCRDRHCPKCQSLSQERWISNRTERLLPTRHFHVVFTLPSELRPLCKHVPREMYDALFEAASRTLLDLAASKWKARIGITAVLHTWTRDLRLHPHVHLLVTAGGLALDGSRWVARRTFLFPREIMVKVFRGKMLEALNRLRKQGTFARFDAFQDPEAFDRLLAKLRRLSWVVYAKQPFRRPEHVLRYLGRYTHRVAISNSRLLEVTTTAVTLRTKGEATVTLTAVEFLRRFVQHVLPDGFHKIRHYGLYASAHVKTHWAQARALLVPSSPAPMSTITPAPPTWEERLLALTGRNVRYCRRCGGPVVQRPLARAPPALAA